MNYERLNRLLVEKKINNAKLAAKAGISAAAIGKILNGADLKVSSLEAIAKALSVPVSFFFEEEQQGNMVIGQQSIAGNGNILSGNSLEVSEGTLLANREKEQDTQMEGNSQQIIASQKEEIINLQKKVISLQGLLLETHKLTNSGTE